MRRKFIILSFIGILFAIIVTLYFSPYKRDQVIVTLVPDKTPVKIKPKYAGGLVLPHSDSLVYNKLKDNSTITSKIHVLPNPEKPLEIINLQKNKTKFFDSIDKILANIEFYENKILQEDNNIDDLEYIKPNLLIGGDTSQDNNNLLENNIILVPGTALKIIKSEEDRYKMSRVNIVTDQKKGYKLQLSSTYSMPEANKKWKELQGKYPKILQNANLIVKKIEGKNERIFYIVMAGAYPSLNHAKIICKKLLSRKQNCIITK